MLGEELGAETGGVWSAANARSAGLRPGQVARRVSSGEWQALRRGVYLDGGVEPGRLHRAWAAVLAAGGPRRAWAVGRTAARLHGLPLVDDDDPCLGRAERVHDDVGVRRPLPDRSTLHPRRWTYGPGELGELSGLVVPHLLRTLWDLRLVLRTDALVCALDAATHDGRVTPAELHAWVGEWPGARGAAASRQAVALVDPRAESPLETLARLVLAPVVPGLQSQVEVFGHDARLLARLDLGVPEHRLGVEADGRTHLGTLSLARDRARERRTGWTFERTTWLEVRTRPQELRARVLQALARCAA